MPVAGAVHTWLESEVQPPEIEVRLYPSFRHSGQGPEGLKVVESGCGAVSVGSAYLSPPLSFGGALLAEP